MAVYELNTMFDRLPIAVVAGDTLVLNVSISQTATIKDGDLLIIRPQVRVVPVVKPKRWESFLDMVRKWNGG